MALDLTGIDNVGEFYSHHYLETLLEGDLKTTLKRWTTAENEGGPRTPMKALAGLAGRFFEAKGRAEGERDPEERWEHVRDLHARLLEALGFERRPEAERLEGGDVVPVVVSVRRGGAPYLWVVEAPYPVDENADIFGDSPMTPQLPEADGDEPLVVGSWRDLLDGDILRDEAAPRWILFLAGREAALVDRDKWGQGRYLRFDLGELFGRREARALRALAGLLHREVLAPDDGSSLHDALDERSHKHAFAVSADLKYGARQAVELIANEAVRYLREVRHEKVYGDDEIAKALTAEALTYLYRLLFLFYVESRGGDLGVVPMQSDAYRQGYSLETLRDLELVPLTTEAARNGYFIHSSLDRLFHIVNRGVGHGQLHLGEGADEDGEDVLHDTFVVAGLRSPLFDPERTPILARCRLRNGVLQQVLQALSLSKQRKSKSRGRISYAQLGINQLGAVYEGLLSYSGFFAQERLYEVRSKTDIKDSEARTYFVPESEIERFDDGEIVRDEDDLKVRHERGTFVFRLAGRDREKSASYYTPEVLTRCLTKYTLRERLGEPGTEGALTAGAILELTVCEPAMGSGAFLNEAVNQLADAYLERKQAELGLTIPADEYQRARQRVKYRLAVNNVYGVDLNPLAAELGKVSLWLNVLQPGVPTPWFGLRIGVGNSLIGARREVFRSADLVGGKGRKKADLWLSKVPTHVPVGEARPAGTVYHFLVPDEGMAPFDKDKVVKALTPDQATAIKDWRAAFCKPFSELDVRALERISDRIDRVWEEHLGTRRQVLEQTRQRVPVWGEEGGGQGRRLSAEEAEEFARVLSSGTAAGRRLAAAMDYWCALWFWPIREAGLLPTRDAWLMEVEALLDGDVERVQQEGRLRIAADVARRMRFFHWEVAFAEVFAATGGFDVLLGNPPWIKVEWKDAGVLSEFDAHVATRSLGIPELATVRAKALASSAFQATYLTEAQELMGLRAFIGTGSYLPLLGGAQVNLYKAFLARSWTIGSGRGAFGFIHEPGIFGDPKGGMLRSALYERATLIARFTNELELFTSIDDTRPYAFSVGNSSPRGGLSFVVVSNLFHPRTLLESLTHDGKGAVPGIKTPTGAWELRGHRRRVLRVDGERIALFSDVYGPTGCPHSHARLPAVHSEDSLHLLEAVAKAPARVADLIAGMLTTVCFDESGRQADGVIIKAPATPRSPHDLVLSGPHFFVGNPLNKSARPHYQTRNDYDLLELETLDEDFLPGAVFAPGPTPDKYAAALPRLGALPFTDYYRIAFRRRFRSGAERSLICALFPPGPSHIDGVFSLTSSDPEELVGIAGMASALPTDAFVRMTEKTDFRRELVALLPGARRFRDTIAIRVLRLNCLTLHYAALWAELWDDAYAEDGFVKPDSRLRSWGDLSAKWTTQSAIRSPFGRRQLLLELDALASLELGISADELCAIYRTQFPVLHGYERETFFDSRGRIVFTVNKGLAGVGLSRSEWSEVRGASADDLLPVWARDTLGPYEPPFDSCDREADLRQAYTHFAGRYAGGSSA